MAAFNWGVICKRIIVDQNTSLPTAIDIMDGLHFSPMPEPAESGWADLPMRFACLVSVSRSIYDKPETVTFEIFVVSPNGEAKNVSDSQVMTIDLTVDETSRTILNFGAFPYNAPGRYRLRVVGVSDEGDDLFIEIPIFLAPHPQQ